LPEAVRLNDLRIVPPGANFPSFSRETWSVTLSLMNVGEI
jgi:hypothetical protein